MAKTYEQWVVALARWITDRPWTTMLLVVASTFAVASGVRHIGFDTDYRVFFGPDNPQLLAWDEVQNVYTKNDNIIFMVEPPGETVFTKNTLSLVEELTEAAWTLPFALRVDSLTNYQHTEANGDDLTVAKLVDDASQLDPAGLQRVEQIATNEPLLVRKLVSPSGHMTGVNLTFQYPQESLTEVPTATAEARELRDALLAKYPGHKIYMSGSNMMNNAFSEASQADMATLFPLMYLTIIVIMFLLLRSVSATIATLGVIILSAAGAIGAAGYLGIKFTPPSITAPVIITTLAVADSVHLLVSFFANRRQGMDKREALVESMRVNFTALLLTSLTTAFGFLTINLTDSPPLHDLGNITAIGVILAWIISVSFLPALITLLPMRPPKESSGKMSAMMENLGGWIVKRRWPVLISVTLVSAGMLALVPKNEANDLFAYYFDESIEYRTDTDYMVDNLTGLYTIEFSLAAPGPNGVADPEYLRKVEEFADWWRQDPRTMNIFSITDIFKRLNKNMHGDDPAWYKLPEERNLAAQYLLLYEFSLPFGLDLNNQLNIDKSASRFVVTLEHLKSTETRQLVEEATAWLAQNAPEMETIGVSPAVMFAYIAERNIRSMFYAIPLSLLVISLLMIPALRSFKLGALSVVPNLLPLGVAFGVWALVSAEINFTMAVTLGMVMGIIVDDTIHFLTKYRRARQELGLDPEAAIRYAFRTVGTALLVTSVILSAGFLIISTSAFLPNGGMAQLTTIAIVAALVVDFFLLPPLLLLIDRDAPNKSTEEVSNEPAYAQ